VTVNIQATHVQVIFQIIKTFLYDITAAVDLQDLCRRFFEISLGNQETYPFISSYIGFMFCRFAPCIGSPKRICFMLSEDGNILLITPYLKRDLKSHNVPDKAYSGEGSLEISSYKLCGK
ncbi:MAG: hypothetical protein IJI45_08955, partial [Anaerolineaceae bacterium]|nr:hypothetical protein [Anaerolineaceae bacterium]